MVGGREDGWEGRAGQRQRDSVQVHFAFDGEEPTAICHLAQPPSVAT